MSSEGQGTEAADTFNQLFEIWKDDRNACILPIGQLSEEALESRHKDAKRFREHNTRKCSRLALMEDLFHALLYSSDPLINSLRYVDPHRREPLDKEVLSLLKEAPADSSMDDIDLYKIQKVS